MTVSPGALIAHYGSDGCVDTARRSSRQRSPSSGELLELGMKTGLCYFLAVNNKPKLLSVSRNSPGREGNESIFARWLLVRLTLGPLAHYLYSNQSESQQIFP